MARCILLPDAPPASHQDCDYWQFKDAEHDDYARADELEATHALYADSGAYTVQRIPAPSDD
jgi:hypothetical protein